MHVTHTHPGFDDVADSFCLFFVFFVNLVFLFSSIIVVSIDNFSAVEMAFVLEQNNIFFITTAKLNSKEI